MPRLTETQVEWSGVAHDRAMRRIWFQVIMRKEKHGCVAGNG
jgi:hypothetical protein